MVETAETTVETPDDLAQAAFIELLCAGHTIKECAAGLQVGERTLYRWKKDERFKKKYDERCCELIEDMRGRFTKLVELAVSAYEAALTGADMVARQRAAADVLRTYGMIGDGAQSQAPVNDEPIEMIPIGVEHSGKVVPLIPPNEADRNAGPDSSTTQHSANDLGGSRPAVG